MKKYSLVDIFRLICACLVVMIHCVEIREGHPIAHMIVTCFSRQAVPFFFIVSGFFFYKKLKKCDNPKEFVLKYSKRIFILYFVWILISFPELLSSYSGLYEGSSWLYLSAVLVRRVFFAGYSVFWYLLVMAESALICGYLLFKNRENVLYVVSAIGLILGFLYSADVDWILINKFNDLIYTVFSSSGNVIMTGLPYFSVGCAFASAGEKFKANTALLWTLYILVSAVNVVAFATIYDSISLYEKYFYLYSVQAILLFMIGISSNVNLKDSVCVEFRNISSAVYCLHSFVIYHIVDRFWTLESPVPFRFVVPLAISVTVYFVVKKINYKPLLRLITLK